MVHVPRVVLYRLFRLRNGYRPFRVDVGRQLVSDLFRSIAGSFAGVHGIFPYILIYSYYVVFSFFYIVSGESYGLVQLSVFRGGIDLFSHLHY